MIELLVLASIGIPVVFGDLGISWAAAGALAGTLLMAAVQYVRGRSQDRVDVATIEALKADAGRTIDQRWEAISNRVEQENHDLRDELLRVHGEANELRERVAVLEDHERTAAAELQRCRETCAQLLADRPGA